MSGRGKQDRPDIGPGAACPLGSSRPGIGGVSTGRGIRLQASAEAQMGRRATTAGPDARVTVEETACPSDAKAFFRTSADTDGYGRSAVEFRDPISIASFGVEEKQILTTTLQEKLCVAPATAVKRQRQKASKRHKDKKPPKAAFHSQFSLEFSQAAAPSTVSKGLRSQPAFCEASAAWRTACGSLPKTSTMA